MIKNRTIIEVEVKGREYQFQCAPDSPLDEVDQAVSLISQYVKERLATVPAPAEPCAEEVKNVD